MHLGWLPKVVPQPVFVLTRLDSMIRFQKHVSVFNFIKSKHAIILVELVRVLWHLIVCRVLHPGDLLQELPVFALETLSMMDPLPPVILAPINVLLA